MSAKVFWSLFYCVAGLLPPPALSERCHGGLSGRSIARRWLAAFVMRNDERPHPRASYRRGVRLVDTTHHNAIRKYVEVVVIPLAGRARGGRAFEDQRGHSRAQSSLPA
jgi:hypothetical protein